MTGASAAGEGAWLRRPLMRLVLSDLGRRWRSLRAEALVWEKRKRKRNGVDAVGVVGVAVIAAADREERTVVDVMGRLSRPQGVRGTLG